jgi:RsiW-degrading membrane proteinase PrsW (M82 family)
VKCNEVRVVARLSKILNAFRDDRHVYGRIVMEEGSVPPPPPPPFQEENARGGRGLHLPRSNFFKGFRRQIAAYEVPADFREGLEPVLAGIGAFILSAFFTLFISLGQVSVFSPIFSGEGRWIGSVFLAPPVEETMKGLSVMLLMLFVPRAFPNRRYAAAIGAAAGLGYALSEDITYFGNPQATPINMIVRLVMNPIGHPVYTAICAIGVFVFVARLRSGIKIQKALLGLPLVLWLIAVLSHAFWNAYQFSVVPSLGYWGILLSLIIIVLPCMIILRDFLGGHFNFGTFFETIPEPPPPAPSDSLPPADEAELKTANDAIIQGEGGG